ncbi:MAG: InlB B-repeat-containing protein [Acholeplasmataceae bacterium]
MSIRLKKIMQITLFAVIALTITFSFSKQAFGALDDDDIHVIYANDFEDEDLDTWDGGKYSDLSIDSDAMNGDFALKSDKKSGQSQTRAQKSFNVGDGDGEIPYNTLFDISLGVKAEKEGKVSITAYVYFVGEPSSKSIALTSSSQEVSDNYETLNMKLQIETDGDKLNVVFQRPHMTSTSTTTIDITDGATVNRIDFVIYSTNVDTLYLDDILYSYPLDITYVYQSGFEDQIITPWTSNESTLAITGESMNGDYAISATKTGSQVRLQARFKVGSEEGMIPEDILVDYSFGVKTDIDTTMLVIAYVNFVGGTTAKSINLTSSSEPVSTTYQTLKMKLQVGTDGNNLVAKFQRPGASSPSDHSVAINEGDTIRDIDFVIFSNNASVLYVDDFKIKHLTIDETEVPEQYQKYHYLNDFEDEEILPWSSSTSDLDIVNDGFESDYALKASLKDGQSQTRIQRNFLFGDDYDKIPEGVMLDFLMDVKTENDAQVSVIAQINLSSGSPENILLADKESTSTNYKELEMNLQLNKTSTGYTIIWKRPDMSSPTSLSKEALGATFSSIDIVIYSTNASEIILDNVSISYVKDIEDFEVVFDLDYEGALNPDPVIVKELETVPKPTDPSRDDYIFLGWFLDDVEYDFDAEVLKDLILVAKWQKISSNFDVKFDYNYKNSPDPVVEEVEDGETVLKPTDPIRDGYSFEGWYLGDDEYDFSSPVTNDITLKAKWDKIPLVPLGDDPLFNIIKGKGGEETTLNEDGSVSLKLTFAGTGGPRANGIGLGDLGIIDARDFSIVFSIDEIHTVTNVTFSLQTDPEGTVSSHGWGLNFVLRKLTNNTYLIMLLTPGNDDLIPQITGVEIDRDDKISIIYDYEGTDIVQLKINDDVIVSIPNNETAKQIFDAHYEQYNYETYLSFSAYHTSSNIPNPKEVVYIVHEINNNKPLDFYKNLLNDAVVDLENAANALDENSTLEDIQAAELLNVFEEGTYADLMIADTDDAFLDRINDALDLINSFKPNVYEITFDLNYDDAPDPSVELVTEGETLEEPDNPIRVGYEFLGWFLGDDEYDFDLAVNDDFTLLAKWELSVYQVTFDEGYVGAPAVSKVSVDHGNKVTEPETPSRDGYKFIGWYLGTEKFDFDDNITKNITLIAKWEEDETPDPDPTTYTVTFDLNYEDSPDATEVSVVEGNKVTKPSNPTRDGYEFLGWYLEDEVYDFDDNVEDDLTLKAKWNLIEEIKEPSKNNTARVVTIVLGATISVAAIAGVVFFILKRKRI